MSLGGEYPVDRIALKEPISSDTLTKNAIEDFLEEAATWKTIDRREREKPRWSDSEHIVGVVDTGEQLPWIATEYMDGGSLANRLEATEESIAIDEALWIADCLCQGLEIAHSNGVAHLDLNPGNILFRKTGGDTWDVPKLSDWGLARVLANQTGEMEHLSVSYAAPEQFAPAEFGNPDTLTDVYQLGVVLYVMSTGKLPYSGSQLTVKHGVTTKETPPPPSHHRPSLSEAIDAAIVTAIEPDKTDRYDSIHGFKRTLQAIRRDERLPKIVEQRRESANNPRPSKGQSRNGPEAETEGVSGISSPRVNQLETEQSKTEPDEPAGQTNSKVTSLSGGDVIELKYTARTVDGGQLIDTTDRSLAKEENVPRPLPDNPQTIILGEGYLFEYVEEDIIGQAIGDKGEVIVPANEAFGEYDEDAVRTMSKDNIPEEERYPGARVEIDGEEGFVETIIGDRAKIDFNHSLRGKDIKYEYEIVNYIGERSDTNIVTKREIEKPTSYTEFSQSNRE